MAMGARKALQKRVHFNSCDHFTRRALCQSHVDRIRLHSIYVCLYMYVFMYVCMYIYVQ
jgi:hypothetical protein